MEIAVDKRPREEHSEDKTDEHIFVRIRVRGIRQTAERRSDIELAQYKRGEYKWSHLTDGVHQILNK